MASITRLAEGRFIVRRTEDKAKRREEEEEGEVRALIVGTNRSDRFAIKGPPGSRGTPQAKAGENCELTLPVLRRTHKHADLGLHGPVLQVSPSLAISIRRWSVGHLLLLCVQLYEGEEGLPSRCTEAYESGY